MKETITQEGDVIMPQNDKGIQGSKNPDEKNTTTKTPESSKLSMTETKSEKGTTVMLLFLKLDLHPTKRMN